MNNVPTSLFVNILLRMFFSSPFAMTVYVFDRSARLAACILVINPPVPISLWVLTVSYTHLRAHETG